ncbi:hypothetical protein, partial [Bacillus luti]
FWVEVLVRGLLTSQQGFAFAERFWNATIGKQDENKLVSFLVCRLGTYQKAFQNGTCPMLFRWRFLHGLRKNTT